MSRVIPLPSSRLRRQITIQQQVQTPDGAGGFTRSWQNVATVWAQILPLSGVERLQAMQLQSVVTHRVIIRYRSDLAVTASMRLLSGARTFNIRAVLDPQEKHALWEILAEEGAAT